ncbi:MAG: hypothetical protein HYT09_03850, partial [Candidatus Levybacteria bacterium]|nr:hypothetical protein [Candidatus Levybacteria bacterium]
AALLAFDTADPSPVSHIIEISHKEPDETRESHPQLKDADLANVEELMDRLIVDSVNPGVKGGGSRRIIHEDRDFSLERERTYYPVLLAGREFEIRKDVDLEQIQSGETIQLGASYWLEKPEPPFSLEPLGRSFQDSVGENQKKFVNRVNGYRKVTEAIEKALRASDEKSRIIGSRSFVALQEEERSEDVWEECQKLQAVWLMVIANFADSETKSIEEPDKRFVHNDDFELVRGITRYPVTIGGRKYFIALIIERLESTINISDIFLRSLRAVLEKRY